MKSLNGHIFIKPAKYIVNDKGIYTYKLPTLIRILQRIIQCIRIPVEVLGEIWTLDLRVRTQETSQHRVVESGVHVDEAVAGQVLVAAVAAAKEQ